MFSKQFRQTSLMFSWIKAALLPRSRKGFCSRWSSASLSVRSTHNRGFVLWPPPYSSLKMHRFPQEGLALPFRFQYPRLSKYVGLVLWSGVCIFLVLIWLWDFSRPIQFSFFINITNLVIPSANLIDLKSENAWCPFFLNLLSTFFPIFITYLHKSSPPSSN